MTGVYANDSLGGPACGFEKTTWKTPGLAGEDSGGEARYYEGAGRRLSAADVATGSNSRVRDKPLQIFDVGQSPDEPVKIGVAGRQSKWRPANTAIVVRNLRLQLAGDLAAPRCQGFKTPGQWYFPPSVLPKETDWN